MGILKQPETLDERMKRYGFNPALDNQRGSLIPVPAFKGGDSRNPSNYGWAAPQMLYGLLRSIVAPGHIMAGGTVQNPEKEATDFAMNVAGMGGGAAVAGGAPRGVLAMGGAKPGTRGILGRMPKRTMIKDPHITAERLAAELEKLGYKVSHPIAKDGRISRSINRYNQKSAYLGASAKNRSGKRIRFPEIRVSDHSRSFEEGITILTEEDVDSILRNAKEALEQ